MLGALVVIKDFRPHVVELNLMKTLKEKYRERLDIKESNYLSSLEWKRFNYLRHISNFSKTKEEFEEYCEYAKRLGMPKPDRNSKVRPLHEKYDSEGILINPDFIVK